jgi:hypothetical protein
VAVLDLRIHTAAFSPRLLRPLRHMTSRLNPAGAALPSASPDPFVSQPQSQPQPQPQPQPQSQPQSDLAAAVSAALPSASPDPFASQPDAEPAPAPAPAVSVAFAGFVAPAMGPYPEGAPAASPDPSPIPAPRLAPSPEPQAHHGRAAYLHASRPLPAYSEYDLRDVADVVVIVEPAKYVDLVLRLAPLRSGEDTRVYNGGAMIKTHRAIIGKESAWAAEQIDRLAVGSYTVDIPRASFVVAEVCALFFTWACEPDVRRKENIVDSMDSFDDVHVMASHAREFRCASAPYVVARMADLATCAGSNVSANDRIMLGVHFKSAKMLRSGAEEALESGRTAYVPQVALKHCHPIWAAWMDVNLPTKVVSRVCLALNVRDSALADVDLGISLYRQPYKRKRQDGPGPDRPSSRAQPAAAGPEEGEQGDAGAYADEDEDEDAAYARRVDAQIDADEEAEAHAGGIADAVERDRARSEEEERDA